MKVLVTGSTGFVGSALVPFLKRKGHDIVHLLHRPHPEVADPQVAWNIKKGQLDPAELEGVDAVVHLAGENIFGRWSSEKREKILKSREDGTRLLAETLAKLENKPGVLVSASAVGYYGDRGDEVLTEASSSGRNFLGKTCRHWEKAADPARAAGIRVVNTRFGIILDPSGGALKTMYWPFKLGVAGNLGNGKQYMSWITREDVVGAIYHAMTHDSIYGPVNVVAPNPVTNAEFTRTMHRVMHSPVCPAKYFSPPPAPAFGVKLALGQMGEELLLASERVKPIRLQESGYEFHDPVLEPALRKML